MERYDVYLHNVPKVSEDGKKVIPIDPHRVEEFAELEEAQKFAGEQKDVFERVVLMHQKDDGPKMVERYIDGDHVVAPVKEEAGESQEEASA